MRVLITDDEPIAQNILEAYIRKIPGLELAGKCGNAMEAFSILSKQQVDLLLMDINMPEVNGMDLIRNLKDPPPVIFTTAYTQYAVESYELNAIDYLVKPFSFERFVKAIDKARQQLQQQQHNVAAAAAEDHALFVKSEGKLVKIDLEQLWFVEGLRDYIRLWTGSGKIIVLSTMKHFEEQISTHTQFLRVSRSYIVNLKYITEVEANIIRIKGESITIGNTYHDEVYSILERAKLL